MRSPQASILALVAKEPGALSEDTGSRVAQYAKRTIALADGFLRLARADAGNYERPPTDIADVLTEATDDLWVLASARGVRIVFEADREYIIQGNRSLLIRVFTNILDNAVKFSPDGTTITCRIRSGTNGQGGQVICTIRDQGPGMPPEVVSKLFQRFSHHSQGRAGPVDGVGLGLAFVQSVVRGHDGSVVVHSALGEGTEFELTFPAAPASAHGAEPDDE